MANTVLFWGKLDFSSEGCRDWSSADTEKRLHCKIQLCFLTSSFCFQGFTNLKRSSWRSVLPLEQAGKLQPTEKSLIKKLC